MRWSDAVQVLVEAPVATGILFLSVVLGLVLAREWLKTLDDAADDS